MISNKKNEFNRGSMRVLALLLSIIFFNFSALKAQQAQDVFVPIGKYIQQGDSESLSAWFANNLELDILGKTSDCSKVQATQIMKDFFVTYTPKSFTIIHKSGKAPMKYAIGNLNAGGETFRVTLFVKTQQNSGNQIQQLRIERE
jgi:hypothetical protein